MKHILLLLILISFFQVSAQQPAESRITTEVSEVTVFINNAQVTRKKEINLSKGESLLKFTNLSPFINAKSIQVKTSGNVLVLSVNHQQNYIDKLDKSDELIGLEAKHDEVKAKMELENTHLSILKAEIEFLRENRKIGGKNQELSVINLKDAADFYGKKLT